MKDMMKFRAWNEQAKDMYQDHTVKKFGFDRDWKYMQFTGLLDHKDKEIFEGDIIKCIDKNHTAIYNHKFKVYYVTNMAGFAIWDLDNHKNSSPHYLGFGNYSEKLFEYEVVGNIYENPDLLTLANAKAT